MLALKALISIALLVCVFWLVTLHWDTADPSSNIEEDLCGVIVESNKPEHAHKQRNGDCGLQR